MSLGRKPAAISGVSATHEAEVMTVYPSISAGGFGRLLGQVYDCIPVRVMGVKFSHLVFVLPTAPIAILLYALQKLFGKRYTLTNRHVQIWMALGNKKVSQVQLQDIVDVEIRELPGQSFYKSADLVLVTGKTKEDPIILSGVPRPHVFRQTLLKSRDARIQVGKSLETIKARPALA